MKQTCSTLSNLNPRTPKNFMPYTKKPFSKKSSTALLLTPLLLISGLILQACSSSSVSEKKEQSSSLTLGNIEDACSIINTDDSWKKAFTDTYIKYGVPPHVVMAIIYQESRFVANARPPRKIVLGVPTTRPSDAYGYPQALTATWNWYRDKTGYRQARRNHLPDAVDFIGWYISESYKRTFVSKWNTREQYLAYHDGTGGYLEQTHADKPWLLKVADKVDRHAKVYRKQLGRCYQLPKL